MKRPALQDEVTGRRRHRRPRRLSCYTFDRSVYPRFRGELCFNNRHRFSSHSADKGCKLPLAGHGYLPVPIRPTQPLTRPNRGCFPSLRPSACRPRKVGPGFRPGRRSSGGAESGKVGQALCLPHLPKNGALISPIHITAADFYFIRFSSLTLHRSGFIFLPQPLPMAQERGGRKLQPLCGLADTSIPLVECLEIPQFHAFQHLIQSRFG